MLSRQALEEFQSQMLRKVSRTFALTIPQLPKSISRAVANAYLLCRILDTIEDCTQISADEKQILTRAFEKTLVHDMPIPDFQALVLPMAKKLPEPFEVELMQNVDRVIRITHSLENNLQRGVVTCVSSMGRGMVEFQNVDLKNGLANFRDLNRYCYFVAGTVGELLTHVFCHCSHEISMKKETLMGLAKSFGQGLQMTNILKDLWEDHARGVCWLPQDVFKKNNFNLAHLRPGLKNPEFQAGLRELIAVAHGHLQAAMTYTLMLPRKERGIRKFCLWAIGLAMLTLQNIDKKKDFSSAAQVKISRRAVKLTILLSTVSCHSDFLLRSLFRSLSRRLP